MSSNIIKVYGRGDKLPKDTIKINVTSKSKEEWSRNFSPFFLGPVTIYPFDNKTPIISENFENAWQYLKVYNTNNFVDKDNNLTENYKKWAFEGWSNKKANRFPMGKGKKPLYSIWKGKKLDYMQARFFIYTPLYAKAILEHRKEEFFKLKRIYEENKSIGLFDYDGYDHEFNKCTLEQVVYNKKRKMGHGFVLAMMLKDEKVWEKEFEKGKVIEKSMKKAKY